MNYTLTLARLLRVACERVQHREEVGTWIGSDLADVAH